MLLLSDGVIDVNDHASANTFTKKHVATTMSRKRKIIMDEMSSKKSRVWSELEYEEMLSEAILLREELELMTAITLDLCQDLQVNDEPINSLDSKLKEMDQLMSSSQDLTMSQIRQMCQEMLYTVKYLHQNHFEHFEFLNMQEPLIECRQRFMNFVVHYANMVGLRD